MWYWILGILFGLPLLFFGLCAICACMLSSRISREEEEQRMEGYLRDRERTFDPAEKELAEKP